MTDDHAGADVTRSAAPAVVARPAVLDGSFDIHAVLDKRIDVTVGSRSVQKS